MIYPGKPLLCVERTYFGSGALAALPGVLGELGVSRALIVTDKGVAASGALDLTIEHLKKAGIGVAVYDETQPEPGAEVADGIVAQFAGDGVDGVVGLGGGSCLDTAKVVAVMLKHGGTLRD